MTFEHCVSMMKYAWMYHFTTFGVKEVERDTHRLRQGYSKDAVLPKRRSEKPQIVFMVDGKIEHGGLCDRFRGLISLYHWAIKHGYEFKVYYVSPFRLEDYLLPNNYDWRIYAEDISYNEEYSTPIHIHYKSIMFLGRFLTRMLNTFIDGRHRQYHVYTNILAVEQDYFCKTFNSLFRLEPTLQREIGLHSLNIGEPYISTSFRFMQLLGDFKDGGGKILSEKEREKLIERSIMRLIELRESSRIKRILVASDSETFINRVSKLDFVYTIPGRIVHIDYCPDDDFDLHLKTFVDFFMISNAEKVHLLASGQMYPQSAFAQFAAWIGKKPFKLIKF